MSSSSHPARAQWEAVAIRQPHPVSMPGDLYAELGVARGATRDEISTAYRARAKELHPDARPGDATAAERFARVGAAYRLLGDPAARARYDATLAPAPSSSTPPSSAPPSQARPRPRPSFRLTPRAARWAVGGGTLL